MAFVFDHNSGHNRSACGLSFFAVEILTYLLTYLAHLLTYLLGLFIYLFINCVINTGVLHR